MEISPIVVDIKDAVARLPEKRLHSPFNWTIRKGEQWVLLGPNGAGKSLIADILLGRIALKEGSVTSPGSFSPFEKIKGIAFKDIYSLADCRNSYYQQRWHSTELDELPSVADVLRSQSLDEKEWDIVSRFFGMGDLLEKKLICLSSGELRKFLIVRTLLLHPEMLVLDNPFIGLDVVSRQSLTDFLHQLIRNTSIQIVLLLSNPKDIPGYMTHILPVKELDCLRPVTLAGYRSGALPQECLFPVATALSDIVSLDLPRNPTASFSDHRVTFRMEHVCIRYGSRTILQDLNWEVLNGDKWSLSGRNGSGKSTLLSLLYADNPQSYSNIFYLFDRKRGTGESIWDIKKKIGYVSPEMHLYFMENVPVLKIVTSGFFDSVGLFCKPSVQQEEKALEWMRIFGIDDLKERMFMTLSTGEQRLVLLARSFVKDPALLILDEPLHGLDVVNKEKVIAIINRFCKQPYKTMIYVTHYKEEIPSCVDHHFEL